MNKKGFTLIELLAVIIVLAIIALIATPIIFNVIENAKIKSMENSTYGVIDAVRTQYLENLLDSTMGCDETGADANNCGGTLQLSGKVDALTVAGEKPSAGDWKIDNSSTETAANKRGIKVWGVKFDSMKRYTCYNTSDKTGNGTINAKVTCEPDPKQGA